jgi:hypothetical protein
MKNKSYIEVGRRPENNVENGNHCVNNDQIIKAKPFDFNFDNGVYRVGYEKVMNYIARYGQKCVRPIIYTDDEGKKHWCGNYYLVADAWIMKVGKKIK